MGVLGIVSRLLPHKTEITETEDIENRGFLYPLKRRVSLNWRMIPALTLLVILAGGVALCVIWEWPYLLIPLGVGGTCNVFLLYLTCTFPHLQSLSKTSDKLATENTRLEKTVDVLQIELDEAKANNKEFRKGLSDFEDENTALHGNIEELKQEKEGLHGEIEILRAQNGEQKRNIESLKDLETRLQEDIAANQEAASNHVEELKGLNKSLSAILTLSSKDHQEFGSTVAAFKKSMEHLSDFDEKHEGLVAHLKETSNLLDGIFTTIAGWKEVDKELQDKLKKLNRLKKRMIRIQTRYECTANELERQNAELEKVRSALSSEVSSFKKQNDVLATTCKELGYTANSRA